MSGSLDHQDCYNSIDFVLVEQSVNSNLVQSLIFGSYEQQEQDTRPRPLRKTQPSPFANFKVSDQLN